MKTKKLLLALLALAMLFTAACGKEDDPESTSSGNKGAKGDEAKEEVAELPEYEVKAQSGLAGTPKERASAAAARAFATRCGAGG